MLAGYVAGVAVVPKYVSQERYLAWSGVLGVAFSLGALGLMMMMTWLSLIQARWFST